MVQGATLHTPLSRVQQYPSALHSAVHDDRSSEYFNRPKLPGAGVHAEKDSSQVAAGCAVTEVQQSATHSEESEEKASFIVGTQFSQQVFGCLYISGLEIL